MSAEWDAIAERVIGAKIVAVEELTHDLALLHFEHRGTDDDTGAVCALLSGFAWRDPETGELEPGSEGLTPPPQKV